MSIGMNKHFSKWLLACALGLFAGSAFAEVVADHKHTVMSLLLSENHKDFRTASMIVQTEKMADPEVLDLLAERLLQGAALQGDAEQLRTMRYIQRVFVQVANARYRPVLEQSMQLYTDKDIKSELQTLLATLPANSSATYQAGSLSIDKVRSEVAQVTERNRQEFADRPKQLPPLGQSMDAAYAALGLPDEVRSIDIGYVRLGNIKAFYYGLGVVQFDYSADAAQVLHVVAVMPEVPGAVAHYSGPNLQYAHALASADEKYYRYLVKGGWNLVESDPALAEVLYNKMIALAPTTNKYALDGMVYTLKRLAPLKPAGWNEFLTRLEPLLADWGVKKLARALKKRGLD